MSEKARKLLAEALALSAEDRADLAAELLESLPDEGLHPDWADELERRARRAHEDPSGGEDWETVEARLRSRMRRI